MSILNVFFAVFAIVATWRWANTLEPLPFPYLIFENEDTGDFIIPNGTGSYVYLPFNEESNGLRVKCVSYWDGNIFQLQILQGQNILQLSNNFPNADSDEKSVEVFLRPDMILSGDYSCRLEVQKNELMMHNGRANLYCNTVTAKLTVFSSNTKPQCFTNKGKIALENEFVMLWCVMQSFSDRDTHDLNWSITDDLPCTSADSGQLHHGSSTSSVVLQWSYATSLCVLTENFFTNRTILCGYGTNFGSNDMCSLEGIDILDSQKLYLFPKQFNNRNTTLTFTCKSELPVYPLLWHVFTDRGIEMLNVFWRSTERISINIISNSFQGSSIMEIEGNTGSLIGIRFVVCSTYSEEDGRNFNAISWAGLEKPKMIPTTPVLVSEEGLLPNASLMLSSSVPKTSTAVPNRKLESFNQTERVIYLIIIVILFFLVLVHFGCLMRPIFIQTMNSKRDENVDDKAPPLQANPAYVGYNGNQGPVGNDVQYTEYTPDGTRSLPYAVLQMSANNTEGLASVDENVYK